MKNKKANNILSRIKATVDGPPLLGREWLQHLVLDWRALFGGRGAVRKVETSGDQCPAPPHGATSATPSSAVNDVTTAAGAVAPPTAGHSGPGPAAAWRLSSARAAALPAALQDLQDEFAVLFEPGLGHYNVRRVRLEVDTSVTPRFFKHRPPPFALREAIETEIDRQVTAGILRPVESSRWAAPVVPVKKRDGSVASVRKL